MVENMRLEYRKGKTVISTVHLIFANLQKGF